MPNPLPGVIGPAREDQHADHPRDRRNDGDISNRQRCRTETFDHQRQEIRFTVNTATDAEADQHQQQDRRTDHRFRERQMRALGDRLLVAAACVPATRIRAAAATWPRRPIAQQQRTEHREAARAGLRRGTPIASRQSPMTPSSDIRLPAIGPPMIPADAPTAKNTPMALPRWRDGNQRVMKKRRRGRIRPRRCQTGSGR